MKQILEQSHWFDQLTFDKYDFPECILEFTNSIENKTLSIQNRFAGF